MCCINHHLKAIFIHITKNGGSTIENILCTYYDFVNIRYTRSDHVEFNNITKNDTAYPFGLFSLRVKGVIRYLEGTLTKDVTTMLKNTNPHKIIHNATPSSKYFDLSDYYIFTFVRNPYDRLISSWRHCLKHDKKDKQVSEILNDFINNRDNLKDPHYCHSFITQHQNLINSENKLKIDFIGRFENLNEGLIHVLQHFKIPIKHLNFLEKNIQYNKSDRSGFIDYYDIDTLNFVNDYFKEDFINFNYNICNTLEELKEMNNLYYINKDKLHASNNKLIEYIKTENILDSTLPHMKTPVLINSANIIRKKIDKYAKYRKS